MAEHPHFKTLSNIHFFNEMTPPSHLDQVQDIGLKKLDEKRHIAKLSAHYCVKKET